jgi:predicted CoA-binding protein
MFASDFMKYKNWAVIGDVTNPEKYAYKIISKLKEKGFNTYGIHPKIEAYNVFKTLKAAHAAIDVVDLCINPVKGLEYLKEVKELGIKYVLIQPGAESEDILNYCKENDITAIEGCALVECSKLM